MTETRGEWITTGQRTARCDDLKCTNTGREWFYVVGDQRHRLSACPTHEADPKVRAVAALPARYRR